MVASEEVGRVASLPPPPVFFVTAHSKEVTGEMLVSAHSTGLKVAVFSVSWEWLVSADSKKVTDAFIIPVGRHIGTAHSKGVRRTAGRERMVRRARRKRADLTKLL
jgi:hypothetical protein